MDLLQIDEIWSYISKKQRHLSDEDLPEMGDAWTFVGLDATKKTIVGFCVGKRTGSNANAFALDLRQRVVNRPTISSDGYQPYIAAIEAAFAFTDSDEDGVGFGQVVKQYGGNPSRYQGSVKTTIAGNPRLDDISTSMIERENLTMRRSIGRFHRKTNAFSKKLRNHAAAVALYVAHYNFCRVHETLKTTPAVAGGAVDRVWSIGELIEAALDPALLDVLPVLEEPGAQPPRPSTGAPPVVPQAQPQPAAESAGWQLDIFGHLEARQDNRP